MRSAVAAMFALVALGAVAQQASNAKQVSNGPGQLPKASLWSQYSYQFQPSGADGPYHWRAVNGSLPSGLRLEADGNLSGEINEQGEWTFAVIEADRSGTEQVRRCALAVRAPLTASWEEDAKVNGNRIDGSIKVSNTTGRDFDLTFVVLAVNDIGRATAIGYQHFQLNQHTADMKLPFGNDLSPGNYTVNVDVVGEESQSRMIFRSQLVSAKESVTQGP